MTNDSIHMTTVEEAGFIIASNAKDYGTEELPFEEALGRVLAETITADRDLPPYNRVTMDGIAIRIQDFLNGARRFFIQATQAAGDPPVDIYVQNNCVEIMTGASLAATINAVVPYEQIDITDGIACIKEGVDVLQNQNTHPQGKDKKQHEMMVAAGTTIDATTINIAAAVGKTMLLVKKLPRVVIISTGDELVAVNETPLPYQVRRSNNYGMQAVLAQHSIRPFLLHLPDEPAVLRQQLQACLEAYDVILLSGGVSMGKFDYVPRVLEELQVVKFFHKVRQRPGKPFWFGTHIAGALVFAFPGNPVASFMCLHRYFIPWLAASQGIAPKNTVAVLGEAVAFAPALQYFLQVNMQVSPDGTLVAMPAAGNGSGDFANLTAANAFLELPANRDSFEKGGVFRAWPFKNILW